MTTAFSFDDATLLSRAEDVFGSPLEDKLLMLSVAQGSYYEFSPVTRRLWELLERPISLNGLVAHLLDEYDVDAEVCRAEVRTVIEGLIGEGLIVAA